MPINSVISRRCPSIAFPTSFLVIISLQKIFPTPPFMIGSHHKWGPLGIFSTREEGIKISTVTFEASIRPSHEKCSTISLFNCSSVRLMISPFYVQFGRPRSQRSMWSILYLICWAIPLVCLKCETPAGVYPALEIQPLLKPNTRFTPLLRGKAGDIFCPISFDTKNFHCERSRLLPRKKIDLPS